MNGFFLLLKQNDFLAPWVQAILSALAILIAYELGLRQSRNQMIGAMKVAEAEQRSKEVSFLMVVVEIVSQAKPFFLRAQENEYGFGYVSQFFKYEVLELTDVADSIAAIPLHELLVPEIAADLLKLKKTLRHMVQLKEAVQSMVVAGEFSVAKGDNLDFKNLQPIFLSALEAIERIELISAKRSAANAELNA